MISAESFRDVAYGILIANVQGGLRDGAALQALQSLLTADAVDERIDIMPDIQERMPEAAVHMDKAHIVKVTHNGHLVAVTVAMSTKNVPGTPTPSEIDGLDQVVTEIADKYGIDLTAKRGPTSGWIGGRGSPAIVATKHSHDNIVSDFAKQLDNLFPSPPAANWPAPTVPEGGDEDEPEQR